MEVVRSLLADDPAMLLRESMGISADSTQRAFPSADIDAFFKRIYTSFPQDLFGDSSNDTDHVIISVDPAGGGSSQFAVFSLIQIPTGTVMVRAESYPTAPPPTSHSAPAPAAQTLPGPGSCS